MDFWFRPWLSTVQPVQPARQTNIPTQQMQSYNVQWTILPWVSDEKSKKLVNFVNSQSKSEAERKLMLNDLHQEAIRREQQEMLKKEKDIAKAEMMQQLVKEKDPDIKKKLQVTVNMSNFADILREDAKNGWVDLYDMPDKEVVDKYLWAKPEEAKTMQDYLNGKISSVDVAKKLGVIKEEEDMRSDQLKSFTNVVAWAWASATGLPRFIATNLAKWVWRIAKELWADENKVQEMVDSYTKSISEEQLAKDMGADTESMAYKWTKMAWDIIQVASPSWLGKIGKMAWAKAGQIAWKIAGKTAWTIANVATQWAVDTAVFMPTSEQRLATKWELAWWAAMWVASKVVGKAYTAAKWKIWQFWEKLYAKTINLNPSQIKKISKANIAWESPERWLLDRKISWSLDEVQTKLDNIAEESYKKINQTIKPVAWRFKSEPADKILTALKKKVSGIEGLEDINTKLDDLMGKSKKWYQLSELVDIKRTLDKRIKMYSSSGDPVAQETAEGLRNLRGKLWEDIDSLADRAWIKNLRELSKEVQVATEISNSLENTIAREGKNRAMSLTDLIVWAWVGGWVLAGTQDIGKTATTVAWLLITKKVLENPAVRTKLAVQLDKLNPKVQQEIQKAIVNNTVLKWSAANIFRKALTLAWVKVLESNKQE